MFDTSRAVRILTVPPLGHVTSHGGAIDGRPDARDAPVEPSILESAFQVCEGNLHRDGVWDKIQGEFLSPDDVLRISILGIHIIAPSVCIRT
jgi:hypothetical protein